MGVRGVLLEVTRKIWVEAYLDKRSFSEIAEFVCLCVVDKRGDDVVKNEVDVCQVSESLDDLLYHVWQPSFVFELNCLLQRYQLSSPSWFFCRLNPGMYVAC